MQLFERLEGAILSSEILKQKFETTKSGRKLKLLNLLEVKRMNAKNMEI